MVRPRADRLAPAILRAHPHLDVVRDGPAVRRYAMILARIERVHAWLAAQSDAVFSDLAAGDVWRVYERLERWEAASERAEAQLALSPATRTRLGLEQAQGKRLLAHMREREQRPALDPGAAER